MPLRTFLDSPLGKKQTQADWARALGVSRAYFNQLYQGEKTPSLALALHLDSATEGMVDVRAWPVSWPSEKSGGSRERNNNRKLRGPRPKDI